MAERKIDEINSELVSLNLDDLDVEELERRLEMSVGASLVEEDPGDGGGGGGGGCDTYVCVGLCVSLCGCNSFDACGIDLY